MRLAVYTDYVYRRDGRAVWTERAFSLFIGELAGRVEELTLLGRLEPASGRWNYEVSESVRFVALPHYRSLARPLHAVVAVVRSLRRLNRLLGEVDAVWLLGPHPLSVAFAVLASARRRKVVLGVRQDLPAYVRARHPTSRGLHLLADALEGVYRLLARRYSTVVVGPELARSYHRSKRRLELSVSLVAAAQIEGPEADLARSYAGAMQVLNVGRLDAEKNPLLLPEIVARLSRPQAWRLVVCGDGPLRGALQQRAAERGTADRIDLRGYLPLDQGLLHLYRSSHVLLHVSWTEGLPQVLYEAFAARLPVVATDVGGIREAVGDAVLLIPPGDPEAAAEALGRVVSDEPLRRRLLEAGTRLVKERTIEAEISRLVRFLGDDS